jgi:hypothetical protein
MNDDYQDLRAQVSQEEPMTERVYAGQMQGVAAGLGATNQPLQNNPLAASLAQLDHVVSMIEDKMSRMENRLAPVCSAMGPEGPPAQPQECRGSSVVINSVTKSIDRLVNILARFDQLDANLEL